MSETAVVGEVQYPVVKDGHVWWGPAKGGGNKPARGGPAAAPDDGQRRRERELRIAEKAMAVLEDVLTADPGDGKSGPAWRDKIAAATYVYDKAFGKATQATTVSVAVIDPNTVSDEELIRIAKQIPQ